MQLRHLNLRACPKEIVARIKALPEGQKLRRRAIILRGEDTVWRTALITLEAFSSEARTPEPETSMMFDDLVLDETWLQPREAVNFLAALSNAPVDIGPSSVALQEPQHWSLDQLTANNTSMPEAGITAQGKLQFEKAFVQGLYLNQSGNYFPTLDDAICHWAPFSPCHGTRDGRLGEISIWIPELRVRFDSVRIKENALHIDLAGNEINHGSASVIAAVSSGAAIANERHSVDCASIEIPLPTSYDWWDLALCDAKGNLLDKWSSRDFVRSDRRTGADQMTMEALVREALETGEGQRVEFKPFVDLPAKSNGSPTARTDLKKFLEVAQTAAAMANAGGGHVFLGVNDECALSRDYSKVTKWGEGTLSAELMDGYRRAMLTSLNNIVIMDAPLKIQKVSIDDAIVLAIEIPNVQQAPAEIRDDKHYYLRRGASNTRLSPSEWNRHQQALSVSNMTAMTD